MKANGVTHGKRCACPICDPNQTRLAVARKDAAEPRRLTRLAPPLPALPLAVDRPRTALKFESGKTARFRELLREGVPAARALETIEAEERETTHG